VASSLERPFVAKIRPELQNGAGHINRRGAGMRAERGRRLRILLIAEACNPTWTSVPLVGYQLSRALALRPDLEVTLATHIRNRPALAADPLAEMANICYIDNEWLARPLHRLSRLVRGGQALSWTIDTAMAWPAYMAFERQLHRQMERQLTSGTYDLIHRVTPLTPTMGSPLAALTDVPMLIGPLNGGLPWPAEHPELRHQEREWLVPVRGLYKRLPFYGSTYRHLAGVIAGSRHTASEVPSTFIGRRFYLPENGVDPARFPIADSWPEPAGRFTFITVGRLVPYKGADLIIEAMAGSEELRRCNLVVVGDGPQRGALEQQIGRHGLEANVQISGWVDQPSLARMLGSAQTFVFPSLREFGGGVVLEALAKGLPSVVVDYGGPAELVTPDCGILLPMRSRGELVTSLQKAMVALAADPDRCRRLGAAACQRVRDEFTWDVKAERIAAMYRQTLKI
jgi:glycosyltransferase involved in cell wall biosynthesis